MKKQVKKTVKTASNKQTADAAVAASTSLVTFQAMLLNLDLEKIVPSKLNPRGEIAEAPLAELTDYSTRLRSITRGTGDFTMKPAGYEQVPYDVQAKLVERYEEGRAK